MPEQPAFPPAFRDAMRSQLGDEWEAFAAAHLDTPPVSVRLNPAKPRALPSSAQVPWALQGRYLRERPSFTHDPSFHAGAYYVQEASSMFLEQAFMQVRGDASGLTVLDLCAAPGGKSTHLLSMMAPDSLLVSNEVIRSRASVLAENVQKWGLHNAVVTSSDPQQFAALEGLFDIIVVDAPCSGEGMFRKDPAVIQRWSPDNVALCAGRQQRILDDIWPALKSEGYLIYATCTYNEKENEDNLRWLMHRGDAVPVTLHTNPAWKISTVDSYGVQGYRCYPHLSRGEGFFMAVVKKASGASASYNRITNVLPKLPARLENDVGGWMRTPGYFFLHKDEIRFLPSGMERLVSLLSRHLYIVNAGTMIGVSKQNKVVPAHAAALSVHLDNSRFQCLDADRDTALQFLRKETIGTSSLHKGFSLVQYEGLNLGWLNVLDNRSNNLYPAEWRIRQHQQKNEDPGQ
jgi:16S rRNA C967 or C1407 C5-methylase (RsmB/RsmF family)/NOL1/NOP2/fmu family ribosome biogenesis protein